MESTVTAKSASKRERSRVDGFRLLKSNKVVFFPADKRQEITIGRTRQRDIRVRHPTVSKLHCTVDMTVDDRYIISNAGSKNGIKVAERGRSSKFRPVEWHILEVGNYIRLGDVTLVAVNANGECPITASSAAELADVAMEIYGSRRKLTQLFSLPRRLIERAIRAATEHDKK
jgi:pSer/pThr/pTyr-binding forkhead associated (FHA) protein